MIIDNRYKQGTTDWLKARCGIPTASEFGSIITPAKGDFSKGHKAYGARLAAERIRGGPEDVKTFFNHDMQRGLLMEEEARNHYHNWCDFKGLDVSVWPVGLIWSDDRRFACSPDGLLIPIGSEAKAESVVGGLEIKAPRGETHIQWLEEGSLPDEHKCQVHASLFISGLPWWDFISISDGLPPLIVRTEPDAFTAKLGEYALRFADYVDELTDKMRR